MKMQLLKYKGIKTHLRLAALFLFSVGLLFCGVGSTRVYAAACPTGQTAITNGCTDSNDNVTCNAGYAAAYNGANLTCQPSSTVQLDNTNGKYQCGGGNDSSGSPNPVIRTEINIGCKGAGNPILDATFAIIRFLSDGVGLVIVGSMIVAGIQYTTSRGDPNATAKAEKRVISNVVALLTYIFAYAILNYLIPGAFLKGS